MTNVKAIATSAKAINAYFAVGGILVGAVVDHFTPIIADKFNEKHPEIAEKKAAKKAAKETKKAEKKAAKEAKKAEKTSTASETPVEVAPTVEDKQQN